MTTRSEGFLARSGPELIRSILQCCGLTRELLALVSACRHIYDVWRQHAAAALWPVWPREIPHFRLAAVAVSALHYNMSHITRRLCPRRMGALLTSLDAARPA
jgi:hypothetical protein